MLVEIVLFTLTAGIGLAVIGMYLAYRIYTDDPDNWTRDLLFFMMYLVASLYFFFMLQYAPAGYKTITNNTLTGTVQKQVVTYDYNPYSAVFWLPLSINIVLAVLVFYKFLEHLRVSWIADFT
jgi:ABC-type cobalt transport system substrate-binding protein